MNQVRDPAAEHESRLFKLALAYGLVFWACYVGYALHKEIAGNDFGVFLRAASEPLETVYALRLSNPFAYPPTTLVWLKPWALLGPHAGFALWIVLSVGAMGWATRRLVGSRVALLVIASPAMAATVVIGQFGALVGAMILFAFSLKGWRQGLLLGLAATIKPQILLAAPLILLIRRDWSALLGAAVAGGIVVMVQLLLFGPDLWFRWLDALGAFPRAVEFAGAYVLSVGPAGLASHFGYAPWPFLALGAALAAALLWKRAHDADPVELAALVIIASAFLSPYLLVYDLAAMMPFVVRRMLARDEHAKMPALAVFLAPFAGLSILWLACSLIAPSSSAKKAPASPAN